MFTPRLLATIVLPCAVLTSVAHAQPANAIPPKQLSTEATSIYKQIQRCWKPRDAARDQKVALMVHFKPDGSLDGTPVPEEKNGTDAYQMAVADAISAVTQCQPIKLPDSGYERWKLFVFVFAPVPNR
ncbi:hypothetical protein UP09_30400 [Bradyrhizobium sp. LTSP885]|uniref:cell envelope integrity protein TolA n=1 Tax=Bradyrhizobium sp. LTSP885 TaxID=1619232 RepID=UPI0005C8E2AD|nr:cell envelope integrity protein TolA [Bradyrhizobium sp. LTSP885]KJC35553.1 hypothetical protein UP09_30400 [Bradyrhizobium sp. LTSP885]